jgi:hypothetical protein
LCAPRCSITVRPSETILLLPEISARLVILECSLDEHESEDDFGLMDWTLGGEPQHPGLTVLEGRPSWWSGRHARWSRVDVRAM